MSTKLRTLILDWARDVRVLLDACRQLVEYYGTDEELSSFDRAAQASFRLVDDLTLMANGAEPRTIAGIQLVDFTCSEALARVVTPILRILVEWEPDFTTTARKELEPAAAKAILVAYGQFVGITSMYLCDPIWIRYPMLAPSGWHDVEDC